MLFTSASSFSLARKAKIVFCLQYSMWLWGWFHINGILWDCKNLFLAGSYFFLYFISFWHFVFVFLLPFFFLFIIIIILIILLLVLPFVILVLVGVYGKGLVWNQNIFLAFWLNDWKYCWFYFHYFVLLICSFIPLLLL